MDSCAVVLTIGIEVDVLVGVDQIAGWKGMDFQALASTALQHGVMHKASVLRESQVLEHGAVVEGALTPV